MPPQFEKSVPMWSFILTVATLLVGGIATASTSHYRLGKLEEQVYEQKVNAREQEKTMNEILQSLSRIEERVNILVETKR
jgi:hypothetical protein